jgi:hypothetical protein
LKNTVTLIDRYVFSFVVQNQPFRMSIHLSTHKFCEWAVLGRWGQWGVGILCSFEDSRASSWGEEWDELLKTASAAAEQSRTG